MPICCARWAKDFLSNVCNVAWIFSGFPQHVVFCMFLYPVEWNRVVSNLIYTKVLFYAIVVFLKKWTFNKSCYLLRSSFIHFLIFEWLDSYDIMLLSTGVSRRYKKAARYRFWTPVETCDFTLLWNVQTGCGTTQPLIQRVWVFFPGGKVARFWSWPLFFI